VPLQVLSKNGTEQVALGEPGRRHSPLLLLLHGRIGTGRYCAHGGAGLLSSSNEV
jgi:hypothetical protein